MRDIANGRGLTPLFEGELRADAPRGAAVAERPAELRLPGSEGLKRTLDGVGGLGWSVIGFLLGAVFWHFVGFWGFVSDVVLSGGPNTVKEKRVAEMRMHWVRTADASVVPQPCVALALDRRTGVTSARACDAGARPFAADVTQGREDRIVVSDSAAGGVAPPAPAGPRDAGEP